MAQPTPVQQLRELVNAGDTLTDTELEEHLATAVELLAKYLTDNGVDVEDVPTTVMTRATRLVAAEIIGQDEAPNGYVNQQFAGDDGTVSTPVRISADPLRPAYALLGMWVDPVTFA